MQNGNVGETVDKNEAGEDDSTLADYVENFARALFLIVYMVFNCVYWVKYRNAKYDEEM